MAEFASVRTVVQDTLRKLQQRHGFSRYRATCAMVGAALKTRPSLTDQEVYEVSSQRGLFWEHALISMLINNSCDSQQLIEILQDVDALVSYGTTDLQQYIVHRPLKRRIQTAPASPCKRKRTSVTHVEKEAEANKEPAPHAEIVENKPTGVAASVAAHKEGPPKINQDRKKKVARGVAVTPRRSGRKQRTQEATTPGAAKRTKSVS